MTSFGSWHLFLYILACMASLARFYALLWIYIKVYTRLLRVRIAFDLFDGRIKSGTADRSGVNGRPIRITFDVSFYYKKFVLMLLAFLYDFVFFIPFRPVLIFWICLTGNLVECPFYSWPCAKSFALAGFMAPSVWDKIIQKGQQH